MKTIASCLILVLCVPALAKDFKPTTCSETAARVLTPYLDSVKRAEEALEAYKQQNKKRKEDIRDYIKRIASTKALLEALKKRELENYQNRLKWAHEAIQEITSRSKKQIAERKKRAAELRSKNLANQAKQVERSAKTLERSLASGDASGYKKELRQSHSINAWRTYIRKTEAAKSDRMAAHAAGTVLVFNRNIRRSISWKSALEAIAKEEQKLADADARKNAYFLKPVRVSLTGDGIDQMLRKRKDALADARTRISAGTYRLFVPTIRTTTDRNGVLKMIADANRAIEERIAAWRKASYRAFNPERRASVTNGWIKDAIAAIEKKITDFQSQGDHARVFVKERPGSLTGQACKDAQSKAKDAKAKAHWAAMYGHWQKAVRQWVFARRGEVEHLQDVLKEHERVFKADIKNRRRDINTRLKRALAETPCGGKTTSGELPRDIVVRHIRKLGHSGESKEETQRRLDEYGDKIYVSKSSGVHGDPRDAWKHALRDTEMKDPGLALRAADFTTWLKDMADWAQGLPDAKETIEAFKGARAAEVRKLMEASETIRRFLDAFERLDAKADDFYKNMRLLRTSLFKKMEDVFRSGILEDKNLGTLIETLDEMGAGSREAQAIRRRIEALRTLAALGRSIALPSLKSILGRVKSVPAALASTHRAMTAAAVKEFGKTWSAQFRSKASKAKAGFQNMSKWDRRLLLLSLAASTSEVIQNKANGMATSEAVGRSAVNLAIDFAIAGFPVTLAAEAGSQILFTTASVGFGQKGMEGYTLSSFTKWVAGRTMDAVASGSAAAGRLWEGAPANEEILKQVDLAHVRRSLSTVESQLDALPPGDPGSERLMRSRARLRQLIRAKEGRK